MHVAIEVENFADLESTRVQVKIFNFNNYVVGLLKIAEPGEDS